MANLNLSYDDLASVICLAIHLADADGNITDDEMGAIIKSMRDQYDFEGQDDLLREYVSDGMNMQPMDAIRHIAAFGPTEKQWASNFFAKTVVADGNLEENESSLYWDIVEKCGLPEHNLEGTEYDFKFDKQTCVTINYRRVNESICDGYVEYVQYDRNANVREKVFQWFRDAETLQFYRNSSTLEHLNAKLGFSKGWHLIMVYANKDYWSDPKLNRAGSVIAGKDIYGPVFFVLEHDDKTLMGFNYKSFVKILLNELYALDNGVFVVGEEQPGLSRRYLVTALTALDSLTGKSA